MSETVQKTAAPAQDRIVSIDALRGFDMFWIMGPESGHWLITSFVALLFGNVPPNVAYHLSHHWGGFSAWDMVMPLFLFIVGAAMPFSVCRRVEAGDGRWSIYGKALRRVAMLWFLGMIAQGNLLRFHFAELKFFSNTLQAIAAGYLIATIALVELRRICWQIMLVAVLLIVYALIMDFVPPPGGLAGDFSRDGNLAIRVDHILLGSHQDGTPYAWILGSLGFGATVMMGVLSGHLLRSPLSGPRKVCVLAIAGIVSLALGWAWSPTLPIIKHLWTSSMVLWAGGWSLLLLALFYGVIDVLGFKRWAFPFQVIGANAIVAYMLNPLFRFGDTAKHLFGGFCAQFGQANNLMLALLTTLSLWWVLYYLYRNRIFVKV